MEPSQSYQVKLDIFEGPLDLLLFLIKRKKISIHEIPISTITREYLEYLNQKNKINLEREAEFLLMAALLIYIKSRMLLPRESDTEDEEDPRHILIESLMEHKKIKAACGLLRKLEEGQAESWERSFLPSFTLPSEELTLGEVSLFDLAEAFFTLMKKREDQEVKTMATREISIEEKMEEILQILREKAFIDFLDYFHSQTSIEEALISFFSLLELIKAGMVIAFQESSFQAIRVYLVNKKVTDGKRA